MRVLDLFSGIGGFSLGLERAGMETGAFCEYDKKARLVLKKHWPDVPIYEDVRELTYDKLKEDGIVGDPECLRKSQLQGGKQEKRGRFGNSGENGIASISTPPAIDLICGGFPCQPFSVAGKRGGSEDDRHLWPEYFRLIQEIRPRWVIGENVAGLINMGLDQVLSDLESEAYTWETFIIPACAVNAPHRRDRVWILANCNSRFEFQSEGKVQTGRNSFNNGCQHVPHPHTEGPQGRVSEKLSECSEQRITGPGDSQAYPGDHWEFESGICRVANGVPGRVDRLKQLGNAVVPQVVEIIGRAILEADKCLS